LTLKEGLDAGIDMFMVPENWRLFIEALRNHVRSGRVSQERIDDAVRRILTVKMTYGLFERPRPSERPWSNHASFGSAAHREVAREAVRQSLVLLENKASILPLKKDARILVAGKNAHNLGHQCGGFTVQWQGSSGNELIEGGTSVWDGIHALAPNAVLSEDGSAAASGAFDVAIVVIGESPYAEGLGDIRVNTGSDWGSISVRPEIELKPYSHSMVLSDVHPEDLETIRAIRAKGIPVVTVLISGRPLVVNEELEASTAFVAAWLPGSEGGGVADVLFGDYAFSGKLSFSWPKSDFDNPNRGDADYDPLFAFGYGLSS